MRYTVGDAVPLTYTITDAADVQVTISRPDGSTVTPAPALTSSGSPPAVTYTCTVQVDQPGLWRYAFEATGAVTDAEDGIFYVALPAATNVYTTLPELKAALDLDPDDTEDDDDLFDVILTASRTIDGDCDRHFFQVTETRLLATRDPYTLHLGPYMDLVSVTSLATDDNGDGSFDTVWPPSHYQLLCADGTPNINAAPEPRPYRMIRAIGRSFPVAHSSRWHTSLVQVTGTWGWPVVPDRIRRAAMVAAIELFKLKDAPFGALGFADLGIIRVRENPRYLRLIHDYKLLPVAVG